MFYFKLNGKDEINEFTKPNIIKWKDKMVYITEREKGIGLASLRLYWEAPVWSLPHTNNGTRRQEEEHILYP